MDVIVNSSAWLRKTDLTEEQLTYLKSVLTIYPKEYRKDDREEQKKLELFKETATSLSIPRAFFESKKKSHHNVTYDLCQGDQSVFKKFPLKFQGTLRPLQEDVLGQALPKLESGHLGGLISMPTGTGKTVVGLYCMYHFKMPMLVLVHKEFLMDQWIEDARKFFPHIRVGKVQQDICDYKDKHFVVGMIQTIVNREYPTDFFNHFGIIAADEGHHLGSEWYSTAMPKFKSKYRLLLSATFRRGDGAENVFYYHTGSLLAKGNILPLIPKIRRVWTDFHLVKTEKFNPALISDTIILKFLCANYSRNLEICRQIIQAVQAGRKCLVISNRIKHLKLLKAIFDITWKNEVQGMKIPESTFCIGGITKEELKRAATLPILFGTFQYCAEGFNIPALDTLFLTTPFSDVEQVVGRITRVSDGKKEPVVVDFRDDLVTWCKSMGASRDVIYEKLCNPPKPTEKEID